MIKTRERTDKKKHNRALSKKSLKRQAWDAFSQYIRLRDCLETTGCPSFGLCITCGKKYHFKLLQAGHFIPGRNNNNLFSEEGTHAQCYNCNINLKGNTLEYRRQIIQLYGEGADERLEAEARVVKQFKKHELVAIKENYIQKVKELQ